MLRNGFGLFCILLLCISFGSVEGQSKSALGTIAVSPDNKTLVALGYNRTMYVCDPADLSVKKRMYLEIVPYEAWFSKDGKSLVVLSSDRFVNIYDTSNWERILQIEKANDVAVATETNEMVIMSGISIRNSKKFTNLSVHDMTTGEKKKEASVEISGNAIGTNKDGSTIVVISRATTDESEKKERAPKDLKGLERDEFDLRHDGRTAEVLWLDGAFAETHRYKTFYSESGSNMMWVTDDVAYFLPYRNRCASFTKAGDAKLFRTGSTFNYGLGVSQDRKTVAAGGLAAGAVTDMANDSSIKFKTSKLPGFPEYFYGFAIGPDGVIYGGTSGWRIVKISSEGKVISETPVF